MSGRLGGQHHKYLDSPQTHEGGDVSVRLVVIELVLFYYHPELLGLDLNEEKLFVQFCPSTSPELALQRRHTLQLVSQLKMGLNVSLLATDRPFYDTDTNL